MFFYFSSSGICIRIEKNLIHGSSDSSKFSIRPFIDKVLRMNEINYIISDDSLPQNDIDALGNAGVEVIIGSDPI